MDGRDCRLSRRGAGVRRAWRWRPRRERLVGQGLGNVLVCPIRDHVMPSRANRPPAKMSSNLSRPLRSLRERLLWLALK